MSCSLNFLERGYIGDFIRECAVIKGDTYWECRLRAG